MAQPTAANGSAGSPTCPRHPDRVSRLPCQRCGRPTCAECQRPAAVGFHCVDCVREQARSTPTVRTVFGGAVTDSTRPVVSYVLIGVCVAVFALQLAVPAVTDAGYFSPAAGRREPWRMLTAVFLHDPTEATHILFNALCLWQLGSWLEPLLGRARFAAVFLLSGFGGSVAFLLLSQPPTGGLSTYPTSWTTGTFGASGAVCGLFGAAFVVLRALQRSAAVIVALAVVTAAMPLFVPNVAWQAHLGGAATGLLVAGALAATRGRDQRRWQWPAVALVAVLLIALTLARYATAPADPLGGFA